MMNAATIRGHWRERMLIFSEYMAESGLAPQPVLIGRPDAFTPSGWTCKRGCGYPNNTEGDGECQACGRRREE